MRVLFLQLPVPSLVPQQNTGNHLLASSSLYIHAVRMNTASAHQINALPQELCSRCGDSNLIEMVCVENPDVIAFTCTVWNIERTLYISRELKKKIPHVKIWLGGPEIASDAFFMNDADQPFDLAVEGEGEEVFRLLLDGVNPTVVDRIHVPGLKKTVSIIPTALNDLQTIHEPFINGFAVMEQDRVVLSELFRGCRYGCLFCRYHSGETKKNCSIRPYDQVKDLLRWAQANGTKELFLLDPSFEQRPDLQSFLEFLSSINQGPQIAIFAELRAEAVDRRLAEKLALAGIYHIETGLQSVNKTALKNVGRSFDREKFSTGIQNLQSAGIKIRTDIMIGLPGDTPDGLYETAQYVKMLGLASTVQVFKTQVLPGTMLRKQAQRFRIEYEERPPYQVLSTPQWPEEFLDEALYDAEDLLDTRCAPEDGPVILFKNDIPFLKRKFNSTEIVYAYFFDCTDSTGLEYLSNERFTKASFAVSLTCRVNQNCQIKIIEKSLSHFYYANPFSSSVAAIHIPGGFPLDIFDVVRKVSEKNCYSNYLQSLYPTISLESPHRRIVAMLDSVDVRYCSESWLYNLRDIAEIAWVMPVSWLLDGTVKISACIKSTDFVYLDPESVTLTDKDFDMLTRSQFCHQIVFSDVYTQWKYNELRNVHS